MRSEANWRGDQPAEPVVVSAPLRPVEELQALCDAATAGPWVRGWPHNIVVRSVDPRRSAIAQPLASGNKFADAEFIAAARTALPSLLARLRAAEETLTEMAPLLIARSDSESLIEGLEKVRRRLCHYGPAALTCDCKYGASFKGEQSGCPELRRAIAALAEGASR